MAKDLFQTTENSQAGDTALGNDFIDLDDPNNNGDFSENENNIASDGTQGEDGNIDKNTQHTAPAGNDFDFDDNDVFQDEDLDADEFDDLQFAKNDDPPAADDDNENEEEEEEEEESSSTSDSALLDSFNARYGKNFKTQKELDAFLNNDEQPKGPESVVTDKEQQQYDKNKGNIEYINKIIQMDDERAYREDAVIEFFRKHKQKPNAEQMEEIDEQIEDLKEKSLLKIYAQNVRNKYQAEKAGYEAFNGRIDQKVETAKNQQTRANQEKLKGSLKDIYVAGNKNFLGTTLSTQDLQEAYDDVKSGNLVKRIMENPELAANLALMEKKLPEIKKALSQPGYNDGVKSVLKKSAKKTTGNRMGSNVRSNQRPAAAKGQATADEAFLQ